MLAKCERCGTNTKVTFVWQYHLDTVGWCHSENLCENCYFYFSKLDKMPITDTPINDIPELPKLSGIYNS